MNQGTRFSLGHVHLEVPDVERAIAFYTGIFDLEVVERDGPFAFLSWGERHHDVALQERGDFPADGPGPGLYHVAFEVADEAALRAVFEDLREEGVPVSPVDHGISKALYASDPAGNGIEVYADTRTSPNQDWRGRSRPFDPRTGE